MKLKTLLIICVTFALMITVSGCGDKKAETYKWPDTELGKLLPEIEAEVTDISSDEDYISATLKINKDEYKDYMAKCKDAGFKEKEEYSEYDDSCYFTARDKTGSELSLNYDDDSKECSLTLYSAKYMKELEEETSDVEDEEDEEATEEEKTEEKSSGSKKSSSSGIDSDFKQMMDDYEDFMYDYVAFMKKYQKSDDVTSMASDYADMMDKYGKYMDKIDKVDTDELNSEELAYYNEVTQRVLEKLSEVQ